MPNDILKTVADNPALLHALKEFFMGYFALDSFLPEENVTLSNEILGEMVRSRVDGIQKLEKAFRDIERLRSVEKPEPREHPGR